MRRPQSKLCPNQLHDYNTQMWYKSYRLRRLPRICQTLDEGSPPESWNETLVFFSDEIGLLSSRTEKVNANHCCSSLYQMYILVACLRISYEMDCKLCKLSAVTTLNKEEAGWGFSDDFLCPTIFFSSKFCFILSGIQNQSTARQFHFNGHKLWCCPQMWKLFLLMQET